MMIVYGGVAIDARRADYHLPTADGRGEILILHANSGGPVIIEGPDATRVWEAISSEARVVLPSPEAGA